MMNALLAIDFEASCLTKHGRSFPIEVAVADLEGWSRAWLIRPDPAWRDWTWTEEAERLHGISRETLARRGLPAAQVADELATFVGARRVLADSRLDPVWYETLCAAAGTPPAFAIGQIGTLAEELAASSDTIARAVHDATRRVPARHRAEVDALWLATLARELLETAAPTLKPLFPWGRIADARPVDAYLTA